MRATVAVSRPGGNDHRRVGPNCDVGTPRAILAGSVKRTGEEEHNVDAAEQSEKQASAVVEELHGVTGVVVGDDGSTDAATAVKWAAEDATRRGSALSIIRAWSISTAPRPSSHTTGYVPSLREFEEAVLHELEERWGALRQQVVRLDLLPVHKGSAEALIDASKSADVVVVGAAGQGLVARVVVGSVAKDVVRHARCPVVVVPRSRD
jgi:nucleotide-binding universal stress UspA family protein